MLIIPVKEGENIERALKKYKKKFDKTKVTKHYSQHWNERSVYKD